MVAVVRRRLSVTRIASWMSVAMFTTATRAASEECERLKTKLSYKQENAPKDISEVIGVVVERLNSEVVDGVVSDVDVEWTGGNDLLAVGDRFARATVAIGGGSRRGCFEVGFSVTNSDECALPRDHPLAHVCPSPSVCVDTAGSYECACRPIGGGAWDASTSGSCPSSVSTAGCCPPAAHSDEGRACRSAFTCPVDPCGGDGGKRCAAEATCVRGDAPPEFSCVCPEGTVGNGGRCDGDDCGCRTPAVDPCRERPCGGRRETCVPDRRGRPSCVCRTGFVRHPDYGCVDATPPRLELRGVDDDDRHALLVGDVYKEHGVDIVDDNAEDYARSLRIRYHDAISPGKCLSRPGTFPVDYVVATPWTDPPFVQTTRTVVVVPRRLCGLLNDANYSCPELLPDCRPEARCVDSEGGGWTCECPEGLTGDGRSEGDGCRDEEPPTITLTGNDPFVLRVSTARGVLPSEEDDAEDRAKRHEADLRTLLQRDSWCGTPPCAAATDRAPGGPVNVEVVVGEPERTTPLVDDDGRTLAWRIPHDAVDDAGNRAVTRYREVRVVETSADELERAVRREVEEEAYQRGRRDERRRAEREREMEDKRRTPCPVCPEREPCPDVYGTGTNDEEGGSSTTTFVSLPSSETMLSYASLLVLFAALWIPYRVFLLARGAGAGGGADFDRSEQDELMARAVTYHSSPVPSSVSRGNNHDDHDDKGFRTCPPRTSANALGSPYTNDQRTHHAPHHNNDDGASFPSRTSVFSPSPASSSARRGTPHGGPPPPPPRTSMFATAYDAGAPHRDGDASFRSPTEGTRHGNGTDSLYATY